MSYVIAAPCIDHMDQVCVSVCPVECITYDPAVDRKAYIDPSSCIECGACVNECPQSAIYRDRELPVAWQYFADVDRTWYVDPEAARDAVDSLAAVA